MRLFSIKGELVPYFPDREEKTGDRAIRNPVFLLKYSPIRHPAGQVFMSAAPEMELPPFVFSFHADTSINKIYRTM